MTLPPPSVRMSKRLFSPPVSFFNLIVPRPTFSYFPSSSLNSLARLVWSVSSPSSPAPASSARFLLGSAGAGAAAASSEVPSAGLSEEAGVDEPKENEAAGAAGFAPNENVGAAEDGVEEEEAPKLNEGVAGLFALSLSSPSFAGVEPKLKEGVAVDAGLSAPAVEPKLKVGVELDAGFSDALEEPKAKEGVEDEAGC